MPSGPAAMSTGRRPTGTVPVTRPAAGSTLAMRRPPLSAIHRAAPSQVMPAGQRPTGTTVAVAAIVRGSTGDAAFDGPLCARAVSAPATVVTKTQTRAASPRRAKGWSLFMRSPVEVDDRRHRGSAADVAAARAALAVAAPAAQYELWVPRTQAPSHTFSPRRQLICTLCAANLNDHTRPFPGQTWLRAEGVELHVDDVGMTAAEPPRHGFRHRGAGHEDLRCRQDKRGENDFFIVTHPLFY